MGLSLRTFLLDQSDELYRLPNAQFERMLHDPTSHRIHRFAGARVRTANAMVELHERQPIRVVRVTFDILTFDHHGCLDPKAFSRYQLARSELALAPVLGAPDAAVDVVDATSQFVARGGSWAPSKMLARRIADAALGRVKSVRL